MKCYKITEDGIEYEVDEYSNGTKHWWFNDKRHRVNGPAVECSNEYKGWYLDGIEYTKKEYYRELLKRNLITEKQAFIELI